MMGIKGKHLLHCVSPQEGGAGWRMLAFFTEGIVTPGASLLLHNPREDN